MTYFPNSKGVQQNATQSPTRSSISLGGALVEDDSSGNRTKVGLSYVIEGQPYWLANTIYVVGVTVVPNPYNGFVYRCTVGGTSGNSQPSFNGAVIIGNTVSDNQVTWRCDAIHDDTPRLNQAYADMAAGKTGHVKLNNARLATTPDILSHFNQSSFPGFLLDFSGTLSVAPETILEFPIGQIGIRGLGGGTNVSSGILGQSQCEVLRDDPTSNLYGDGYFLDYYDEIFVTGLSGCSEADYGKILHLSNTSLGNDGDYVVISQVLEPFKFDLTSGNGPQWVYAVRLSSIGTTPLDPGIGGSFSGTTTIHWTLNSRSGSNAGIFLKQQVLKFDLGVANATPNWWKYRIGFTNAKLATPVGAVGGVNNGVITNASNTTPIVITTQNYHQLQSGTVVKISGVGGNTAANGIWGALAIDGYNFSLMHFDDTNSVGNGNYTSGGTTTFSPVNHDWRILGTEASTGNNSRYIYVNAEKAHNYGVAMPDRGEGWVSGSPVITWFAAPPVFRLIEGVQISHLMTSLPFKYPFIVIDGGRNLAGNCRFEQIKFTSNQLTGSQFGCLARGIVSDGGFTVHGKQWTSSTSHFGDPAPVLLTNSRTYDGQNADLVSDESWWSGKVIEAVNEVSTSSIGRVQLLGPSFTENQIGPTLFFDGYMTLNSSAPGTFLHLDLWESADTTTTSPYLIDGNGPVNQIVQFKSFTNLNCHPLIEVGDWVGIARNHTNLSPQNVEQISPSIPEYIDIHEGKVDAIMRGQGMDFGPRAQPFPPLLLTEDPFDGPWLVTAGSGSFSRTTDPLGGNEGALLTASSPTASSIIGSGNFTNLQVGDYFVVSCARKSSDPTKDVPSSSVNFQIASTTGGPPTISLLGNQEIAFSDWYSQALGGGWELITKIGKITSMNGGSAAGHWQFLLQVANTQPIAFYQPFVGYVPSGTMNEQQIIQHFRRLYRFTTNIPQGGVGMPRKAPLYIGSDLKINRVNSGVLGVSSGYAVNNTQVVGPQDRFIADSSNPVTQDIILLSRRHGLSSSSFTPTVFSNLIADWNADNITPVSGHVSSWTDSINGYVLNQAGGTGTRPTYTTNALNGHSIVSFDGAANWMINSSFSNGSWIVFWVVMRLNSPTTPGSNLVLFSSLTGGGIYGVVVWQSAGKPGLLEYSNGYGPNDNSLLQSNWAVVQFAFFHNDANSYIQVNDNPPTVGPALSNDPTLSGGFSLGAYFNGTDFLNVDIARILVFSFPNAVAEMSNQDRSDLLAGLFNTYGISSLGISRITTNYTTRMTDRVLLVDTSSARTITLNAAPSVNVPLEIKDITGNAGSNNITINGNGHTIDGNNTFTISSGYGVIKLVFTGNVWAIESSQSSQTSSFFVNGVAQ